MKKKLWIIAALSAMLFLLGVGNLYPVYAAAAEAGKAEVRVTGANVWINYRVSQSFYRETGTEEWTEMERSDNTYTVYLEPGQYEYMAKISEYADNDENKLVIKDKYTRQGVFDIKEGDRAFYISFALWWLEVVSELDESLFPNGLPGINMTVIKDGEELVPEKTVPSENGQGIKEAFYIIDHIGTGRTWDFVGDANYYCGGYELKVEAPEGFDYTNDSLPRFSDTSFFVGSRKIQLIQTQIFNHTIKVPKGAGLHLYRHKGMAYAGMEEQTVSKTATEGDYDVYTGELNPYNRIVYVTGGEGTGFKRTAGFFSTGATGSERTIDVVPKGSVSPGKTNKNNDLYTNVRDGFVRVPSSYNQPVKLEAYRMTQTVMTETTNEFIEPEMKCEILYREADKKETLIKANCNVGEFGNYTQNITLGSHTSTKNSLAVVKITYDEMDKDGTHYPAIDDADTGIVFLRKGGTSEGITPSMTQYDRGTKGQSPLRNDFDTVYFLGTTSLPGKDPVPGKGSTDYTFKAGEGTQVFIHDPVKATDTTFDNEAWRKCAVDAEGNCTVALKNGRNPIKIIKGDSDFYTVINAKKLDVKVENFTHPGKEIAARDRVGVSFDGLELPVYKMSCIYNPGWAQRGDQTWVEYTLNGKDTVDSFHIQYPIATINTIEFKAAEGKNTLSQGQIHCTHMGSGLYAHTEIPSNGLNHNFNAGTGANSPWFNILPEITFTARPITEEEEKDADVREVEELIDKVDQEDPRYTMIELLDALDAYEALDDALKPRVSNADVLTEAYYGKDETDIVRRMAAVIRDIQKLPETADKESAEAIQRAKEKFDALGEENTVLIPKEYSDKLSGLVDGLNTLLANEVIDKITDLGAVTADNCIEKQEAIGQARAAYEALGESARKKVTNLPDLEAAEALLRAADPAMAAVEDQIAAIGEVTAANWKEKQEAIGQARAAYNALSEESKARVSNLKALTDAEAVVSAGQAEEVIAQIAAIGDVTADSWMQKQAAIGQARASYNALPESARALVNNLGSLTAAEATVQSRAAAVSDAVNKINAIGSVTADNWKERKEAVNQARAAYDGLSANEKAQIAGADALMAAEAAVDREAAREVAAQIEAIGEATAENAGEKRTAVGQARVAYNALSDNAKSLVTNLAALEAAERLIQAMDEALAEAIAKIEAIGEVTIENAGERQAAMTEARTAYDALTPEQKALVTNYPALEAAERTAAEAQAVKAVVDRIAAIGQINADNWKEKDAAVAEARTAYDALAPEQKALASNYAELQAAEEFIQTNVVDPVKAKIDQIGALTEANCKEKEPLTKEARAMYDQLTERLKAMVSNRAVLENAEEFLREYNSVNHEMKAFQESAPRGLTAKAISCTAVQLSWEPLKDAAGYRVYRRESGGAWSQIARVAKCAYKDNKAAVGKAYAYKVAGVSGKWGGEALSRESSIANCALKLGKTTLTSVKSKDFRTLKLAWKKVAGATGYTVYRAAKKNGEYKAVAQVKKGNATTYEDAGRTTGVTYYYKVRAYRTVSGETGCGEHSDVKSGKASLPAPKASVKKSGRSATVKWSGVKGATGYQVYRSAKKGGGYKKIADVKKNSYVNKGLKSKKTYYYKVRAYRTVGKKKAYGSFSAAKAVKMK